MLAHHERGARHSLSRCTAEAKEDGGQWTVTGTKSIVPAGDQADAFIVPYAALKGLSDRTGNRDYVRGTTWNWLSEVVGGTGTTPSGERFGACPDSDRIGNLFWDERPYLGGTDARIFKQWMGVTGVPGTFGAKDLSRIPGFAP